MADEEVARRDAVGRKADTTAMYCALEQKADLSHVTEALAGKAEQSQLDAVRQQQASNNELTTRVVALREELQCKASSKVCCQALLTDAHTSA